MRIQLWYSPGNSQWRWTLSSDVNQSIQESGQQPDLRIAMNDIANTVEYLMDTNAMGCSSVVERLTVNQVVAGSSPATPVDNH